MRTLNNFLEEDRNHVDVFPALRTAKLRVSIGTTQHLKKGELKPDFSESFVYQEQRRELRLYIA